MSVIKGIIEYYLNARTVMLVDEITGRCDCTTRYFNQVVDLIETNKEEYPYFYEYMKKGVSYKQIIQKIIQERKVTDKTAYNYLLKEAKKCQKLIEEFEELRII